MNIALKKIAPLALFMLMGACQNPGPTPMAIGKDACHFCKMTIMDKKYGLELVTAKGLVQKFDDVACGLKYAKEHKGSGDKFYVINYHSTGFIDATTARFVKSDKIQSPMSSGIAAYATEAEAKAAQKSFGGEIYSWESIQKLY